MSGVKKAVTPDKIVRQEPLLKQNNINNAIGIRPPQNNNVNLNRPVTPDRAIQPSKQIVIRKK